LLNLLPINDIISQQTI